MNAIGGMVDVPKSAIMYQVALHVCVRLGSTCRTTPGHV